MEAACQQDEQHDQNCVHDFGCHKQFQHDIGSGKHPADQKTNDRVPSHRCAEFLSPRFVMKTTQWDGREKMPCEDEWSGDRSHFNYLFSETPASSKVPISV